MKCSGKILIKLLSKTSTGALWGYNEMDFLFNNPLVLLTLALVVLYVVFLLGESRGYNKCLNRYIGEGWDRINGG